uniref:Uncharacterized protein n=1 Tax=Meloidogyne enterolobii TaxID=390850 RepID=A0A6V7VRP3_MELEN|nr:unnamed protein product [Meloidogyne enterolobii]
MSYKGTVGRLDRDEIPKRISVSRSTSKSGLLYSTMIENMSCVSFLVYWLIILAILQGVMFKLYKSKMAHFVVNLFIINNSRKFRSLLLIVSYSL